MLNLIKTYNLLIIIGLLISAPALGQSVADDLYAAEDWAAAAEAYAAITAADPDDANAWYQLAASARQAGDLDVAGEALAIAETLEFSPIRIGFEKARLAVEADDAVAAVAALEAIAESGFTSVAYITSDPVLATLAGNPAYDALVAEMSVLAYPCENDEAFHEFDFWLGEWVVHGSNGTLAGSNVIERAERGCVIIENWTNTTGGTGMSVNYVDKITGEWVQIWNAEGGSQINIRGGLTDDGMLLVGTLHTVGANTTVPFRGLWTPLPDGRVRQFFEQSNDGGETWQAWFEGFYTRTSDAESD